MANLFRLDGVRQDPTGLALPGVSVAVLTTPSVFTTQPGSPLATLYAANASNAATITAAVWSAGQIQFTFSATPPADVIAGSYIFVSGVTPSAFNTTVSTPWLVVEVSGNNVFVAAASNPGTYVSGGTVATSALPNPTTTDNNGNWHFYSAAGIYGVQLYSATSTEIDLADQNVGTVAGGSVLSVGLTLPVEFSVSGSPITTSGTLAATWANETANRVFAGPTSGGDATPAFRALVAADFPAGVGTVTSVAHTLTVPAGIMTSAITGSPLTTTGTIADTISLVNQTANFVWAGPTSGGATAPTFRALVNADIPAAGSATQIQFNTAGLLAANAALTFATATGTLSATIIKAGAQETVTNASGATDALTFPGATFVTTAGVDAMTLATPTAGTDDGKRLLVVDTTGHAQTVTTAANKIVPSHSLVTFNGTVGSWVRLEAFGGLWYPLENSGVTIT